VHELRPLTSATTTRQSARWTGDSTARGTSAGRIGRVASFAGATRAACADELGAILAADEAAGRATYQRAVCEEYGGTCDVDGARHRRSHMAALKDRPGRTACESHRNVCAVD
jgi:hypothetical protein